MKVENLKVYGLENSFRVCKFSHAVDISKCTEEYTDTIKKLGSAPVGSGHDSFLKGIIVQFDLTCTIKMWIEAERYHWFDIVTSGSTVHSLEKMDLDKVMNPSVSPFVLNEFKCARTQYLISRSEEDYLQMLYSCPVGLELTAGVTTNYLQLKTMYYQRKNHKLSEWREFCKVIEELPYMNDFLKLEDKV